jgi:hypothetical protein
MCFSLLKNIKSLTSKNRGTLIVKILHQMVRKSTDKQWNRPNSILFHETIPLRIDEPWIMDMLLYEKCKY